MEKGENEASEKAIKNLYNELNLTKIFEEYEEQSYKKHKNDWRS